jgi:hypothetical protein
MSLVNPYIDDTEGEFVAYGPFLLERPGRDRAKLTISIIGLNRSDLRERRLEQIQRLSSLADRYVKTQPGPLKQVLRDELCREASADKEYTFFVRAYLAEACSILL